MKFEGTEVTPRDLNFLQSLFESRIMTSRHVADLHFNGSQEAAKKRLQKLKAAGFVGERKRHVTEKAVLFLLKKGIQTLAKAGRLQAYPSLPLRSLERRADVSNSTVPHELEVMDVKTAFHSALRNHSQFSVEKFTTWPLLHQFEPNRSGSGRKVPRIKPDGFIRIYEKEPDGGLSERVFFLEVDRSTESQGKFVRRVADYSEYYTSGDFAVKCGGKRNDFKQFPFRLLIVFLNAERRNNTAKQLLDIRHLSNQVCLSTIDEVRNDPLGKIWITAEDFRFVTKGTVFEVKERRESLIYRRQSEREQLVEAKIRKHSIFFEKINRLI